MHLYLFIFIFSLKAFDVFKIIFDILFKKVYFYVLKNFNIMAYYINYELYQ